jgi:acyl dehydratase
MASPTNLYFTLSDQFEFANIAQDYNPLHVDPLLARRLLYGQVVVHGVNALLWALAAYIAKVEKPIKIDTLKVVFVKPVVLNQYVNVAIEATNATKTTIRLSQLDDIVIRIALEFTDLVSKPDENAVYLDDTQPPVQSLPDEIHEHNLQEVNGKFLLNTNRKKLESYYGPELIKFLGATVVSELSSLSKIIGMHLPGLHSLFTEINLSSKLKVLNADEAVEYKTIDYDYRFRQIRIKCQTPRFTGTLKAFYRPPVVAQPGFAQIKKVVSPGEFNGQRALIIGGSRGLGEVCAKFLVAGGADVTLTYSKGKIDAESIVSDIAHHGSALKIFEYDINIHSDETLSKLNNFQLTDVYYFATPFIFSGRRNIFNDENYNNFMDFYFFSFKRILEYLVQKGCSRFYVPSTEAIETLPDKMGEYIVAKAAVEAYSSWVMKNQPAIKIYNARLPRLSTDQTSSIVPINATDNQLMLDSLRSFINF